MEKQPLEHFAKEGFTKRAQAFGVSLVQAEQLFKKANEGIMGALRDLGGKATDFYNNNREAVNTAGAGLVGAGVGAGLGGLAGGGKGALAGALGGGAIGAGAGHLYQNNDDLNKLKSYLGLGQQGPRSERFDLNAAGTNDEFTQNANSRNAAENTERMNNSNHLARAIMPPANTANLQAYRQSAANAAQPPLIPQSIPRPGTTATSGANWNGGTIGY